MQFILFFLISLSIFACEKEIIIALDTPTIIAKNSFRISDLPSFIARANPTESLWQAAIIGAKVLANLPSIIAQGEKIHKKPGVTPTIIAHEMITWFQENNYGNFQKAQDPVIDFLINPQPIGPVIDSIKKLKQEGHFIAGFTRYNIQENSLFQTKFEKNTQIPLNELLSLQLCKNVCTTSASLDNWIEYSDNNTASLLTEGTLKKFISLKAPEHTHKKIIFLSGDQYTIDQLENKNDESYNFLYVPPKTLEDSQQLKDVLRPYLP